MNDRIAEMIATLDKRHEATSVMAINDSLYGYAIRKLPGTRLYPIQYRITVKEPLAFAKLKN